MKRVRMKTALITVATAVAAVVATTGATGAPTSHTARCGSGVSVTCTLATLPFGKKARWSAGCCRWRK